MGAEERHTFDVKLSTLTTRMAAHEAELAAAKDEARARESGGRFTERQKHRAEAIALLRRGADVNARDDFGSTALMFALQHAAIVELLLDAGAELEAVEPITGHTAFLWACHDGKVDCAEMLVRAGCNSSHRNKAGLTGRDIAQQRGHPAVVERLRAVVVEQLATRASSHGIAIEDEPEPAIDIEPDAAIAALRTPRCINHVVTDVH